MMAGRISVRSIIAIICLLGVEITFPQTFDWVKQIGSSGLGTNSGYVIDVDHAGNVYVTGSFHDTAVFDGIAVESKGLNDMFFAKYSRSGKLIWLKTAGAAGLDDGTSLTMDSEEKRVIVAGFMKDAQFENITLTGSGYFIADYDTSGQLNWVRSISTYGGGTNPSVTVDKSGNVIVTGGSFGWASIDSFIVYCPYFVMKLDNKGKVKWMKGIDPTSNSGAIQPADIVCDNLNNIYVTGFIQTDPIRFDSTHVLIPQQAGNIFLVKYDENGHVIRAIKSYNTRLAFAFAIAIDSYNSVYLTGYCCGYLKFSTVESAKDVAGTDSGNLYVFKYDSEGNPLWAVKSTESRYSSGNGICIDESGNVYITGVATDAPRFGDFKFWSGGMCTAKYNTDGECLFAAITGSGSASYPCCGRDIAVSDSRHIYLTGDMYGAVDFGAVKVSSNDWNSIFIAKLSIDEPVEVNEFSEQAAASILNQNYPNPFNPETKISFTIPYTSFVSLRIYNLMGEVVATPAFEILSAGTHTVMWDATGAASGVYIYCLQAGNYSDKKKLIVQR